MKRILRFIRSLFGGSEKTEQKFPPDIKQMCIEEMARAKKCIESKGTTLKDKASKITVVKVDGEKKFSSGWGWKSPELNGIWVLGLTYGGSGRSYLIKVGCDPQTKQDVRRPVVTHEFGHFWLLSNYRQGGHDSNYSSCFWNWNDPAVKTMSIIFDSDNILVIDYIAENEIEALYEQK